VLNLRYPSEYARDLIFELVIRDLKIRYKRSVLGIFWSFVTPLTQLLVFTLIFKTILKVSNAPHQEASFMIGILSWSWFQGALFQATGSVVDNRELLRRPGFPISVLPLVTVATTFIHYLAALPILGVLVLFDGLPVGWVMCLVPILLVIQFLLTVGPAYVLATWQVKYRDVFHLTSIALMLGFYITPIFYDVHTVPEQYRWLFAINPVAVLIEAHRDIILREDVPDLRSLGAVILGATILALIGLNLYKQASYDFVDEL
jgi:lipopolysaccharide transport system permease protein